MRTAILSLGVASLLAACGTTVTYTATNQPPRPMVSRPIETVEVFATSLPDRPFKEVGIIQGRQSSGASVDEMPEIIAAIREEGARVGCDGIVINGTANKLVGSSSSSAQVTATKHKTEAVSTTQSSTTELEGFWGACVMYLPEPVAAPATVAAPAAPATPAIPAAPATPATPAAPVTGVLSGPTPGASATATVAAPAPAAPATAATKPPAQGK